MEHFVPLPRQQVSEIFATHDHVRLTDAELDKISKKFSNWRHSRDLLEFGPGTLIKNSVVYRMPAGWLGQVALGSSSFKTVKRGFKRQRQTVDRIWHSGESSRP
jgi:ligand-binding SRPBCC domain-containing protein